ncbi:molecular chaperone [bacterium]|nr:molecular chaperone [bacterium]MBU1025512.1 molecular chaperone [bacterium]
MTQKLTKYEKETIILFNEGEPDAEIFTYNKSWQKHLEKKLGLKPIEENDTGGKTYTIDKKRIRPPRAKKQLSQKQKDALKTALFSARNKRAG